MRKRLPILLILPILISSLYIAADERKVNVDFFILFDTSLSMEPFIQDARIFTAESVLGPLVEIGDWVSLVEFYGESKVVFENEISGESVKAECLRTLQSLKADGVYTDIGSALDSLDGLIRKRGYPERAKYILLITDERQEAPKDTKYYSPTYTISHPLLKYVKKVARKGYFIITVGYGIADQVDAFAQTIFKTLTDPPPRLPELLPGASAEGKQSSGTQASDPQASNVQAGNPQSSGTPDAEQGRETAGAGEAGNRAGNAVSAPDPLLLITVASAAVFLALAVLLAIRRGTKKKEEKKPR